MSKTDALVGGTGPARYASRWRTHFALLWSSVALAGLGSMTFGLAIPLLALAHTGSPVLAGWIAAAGMVPRTLLYIPVGLVVDRHDPRTLMALGLTARIACVALLVTPVLLFDAPVALLAAASALHGVCGTLHTTAGTAAVPLLVPRAELAGAAAKNEARNDATQMLGRPLGGALYGLAHGLPALFDTLVCALALWAALLLPRLRPAPPPRRTTRRPLLRELAGGFLLLRGDRFLLGSLLVCAATNALFQVVWLVIMLTATDEDLSAFLLGLVLAATGAGGLLGAVLAPFLVRRLSPTLMVALCLWSWLALTVLLAAAERAGASWLLAALPLVWCGIGFVGAHMNVTVTTYHTSRVPPELLGRLTGTVRFLGGAALPVGALCGGYALESLGVHSTVLLVAGATGVLTLGFTASLLPAVPPRRRPRSGRPRQGPPPEPPPPRPPRTAPSTPPSGSGAPGRPRHGPPAPERG
ncbi:MFS family permease [Nocardiopsis terrae]|uniref:MFS family permease n=1 Tax=Nocardiopsis terrae TaxID=372655 RepID=A0ABR9HFW9_9ACTN|nr:MFS transporter [Nocardiopsis terrae]MBE1457917.1 MFS family permease [Nocardiopsis terrae]